MLVFDAVWLCFILSFVANLFLTSAIYDRLRDCHPAVWERYGRPTLWNSFFSNNIPFVMIISTRDYKDLSDPDLERYVGTARVLVATSGILLVLASALAWHFH